MRGKRRRFNSDKATTQVLARDGARVVGRTGVNQVDLYPLREKVEETALDKSLLVASCDNCHDLHLAHAHLDRLFLPFTRETVAAGRPIGESMLIVRT